MGCCASGGGGGGEGLSAGEDSPSGQVQQGGIGTSRTGQLGLGPRGRPKTAWHVRHAGPKGATLLAERGKPGTFFCVFIFFLSLYSCCWGTRTHPTNSRQHSQRSGRRAAQPVSRSVSSCPNCRGNQKMIMKKIARRADLQVAVHLQQLRVRARESCVW